MPALPGGTVTLLFTDVEGSTRLQHGLGDRYRSVVADHQRLLREALEANGGRLVDRQTESMFIAFSRARDAVAAAAAAQRALAAHEWPDEAAVRVRMGIHSGSPEVANGRYVGLAVARAARICAAAHGGQVLVSEATRALLEDDDGSSPIGLQGLGAHRLKDFDRPQQLSQLVVEGLPARFPPPRGTQKRPRRRLIAAGLILAVAVVSAVIGLAATRGPDGLERIGPTSMGVIDPTTNKLVGEIPLGFKSGLIAAGERFLWVVDPKGSTLVKIDPESREQVQRTAVEAGVVPFGLAVASGRVWVTGLRGEEQVLLEISAEHGGLLRSRVVDSPGPVGGLSYLRALAVGDGAVWLYKPGVGGLVRLETSTGRARTVDEGLAAVSLAAGYGAVWLAHRGEITKVPWPSGKAVTIQVEGPWSLADSIAVGDDAVWYANVVTSAVQQIDPHTNGLTGATEVGRGPTGISVGEGAIWVSASDGTVTRLSRGGSQVAAVSLGAPAAGIVAAFGAVWTSPGEPLA